MNQRGANGIVAGYALDRLAETPHEERRVLAVGGRVFARLEDAGQSVEAHFSFSGDFLGITEVMGKVLAKIDQWRLESSITQMTYLFPIDVGWFAGLVEKGWQTHSLPTYSMDTEVLFSSLVREHLFFSLCRAFVESLASENSCRLSSMQAAERNIDEHLHELLASYRKQRQETISSELLDILTGYEAHSSK